MEYLVVPRRTSVPYLVPLAGTLTAAVLTAVERRRAEPVSTRAAIVAVHIKHLLLAVEALLRNKRILSPETGRQRNKFYVRRHVMLRINSSFLKDVRVLFMRMRSEIK